MMKAIDFSGAKGNAPQLTKNMPLVGLVVILLLGLLLAQVLVLIPLEFIFALKVPLWLTGLGVLMGLAWCFGE